MSLSLYRFWLHILFHMYRHVLTNAVFQLLFILHFLFILLCHFGRNIPIIVYISWKIGFDAIITSKLLLQIIILFEWVSTFIFWGVFSFWFFFFFLLFFCFTFHSIYPFIISYFVICNHPHICNQQQCMFKLYRLKRQILYDQVKRYFNKFYCF